jgi:hypothetical protein
MTTFLFSSFGARLQRCVRVIPTETGPFCEKWERTFNITVNEFSVSGEIREGKREFRDRHRSPGSVRSIRGLISPPRNSRPDAAAGFPFAGSKLRPFVRRLHPATAEGFEEMNHRLHVGKHDLSKLVFGQE